MGDIKKESLDKLLVFIDDICRKEENLWFKERLSLSLNETKNNQLSDEIFKNTETIKKYLNISPELSIDYSFIKHKILKNRLELDNLRMENTRIDIIEKDEIKRLYDYIIYAFYQVENLINFYYYSKYDKIDDLLDHLESIESTKFRRTIAITGISDINIATKIYSFNKTFYNSRGDYTGLGIDSLRKVRNEGLHRCTIIMNRGKDENLHLYNFLKRSTYNSIHGNLESLANTIKENL